MSERKCDIIGMLLNSHAETAAQAATEEFIHHNVSAMMHYDTARQNIEAAIRSVIFAEIAQFSKPREQEIAAIRRETRKRAYDEILAYAKDEKIESGVGVDAEKTFAFAIQAWEKRKNQ